MKRVFILLAALLTLASCDLNEFSNASKVGKPIVFSANTYYQNGINTRTEYSGDYFGETTKYERINWVDTDLMRVWAQVDANNKANGDYSVESHETDSNNQQNSNAKVKSVGNPLTWLSDASHTIYALYPSPATDAVDANKVSLNANVITATIPSTQVVTAASGSSVYKPDMNYAYMWAATQATPGSNVALGFKPLMTAFEFNILSANNGVGLSSFSLVADENSPYLAGDFTATVSNDLSSCAVTSITNGSRTITVNFDDVAITPTNSITFTIFALPQTLTNLTMQFSLSDGTTKNLALKRKDDTSEEYQFITFEAGTKYRITNVGVPGDGWTYTLEEVEPGTAMARTSAAEGTQTKGMYSYRTKDGVTEAVEMQFRYSPADEDGNNLEQWSTTLPEWLTSLLVGEHTDDQNPDDPFTLTGTYTALPANQEITLNQIEEHSTSLKAKGTNGASSSAPQDLALYDVGSMSPRADNGVKTANSYIVGRAGWYMFPLVYGNALDSEFCSSSNGWNVGSYSISSTSTSGAIIKTFRNYVNNEITSPYILDDTGLDITDVEPIIVWEDALQEDLFVNPEAIDIIVPASFSPGYKNQDGTAKESVPFIVFNVPQNKIREGNALIALREKTGDKKIVWSWHIWVSDANFSSTTTLPSRSTTVPVNNMLAKPLGFCDDIVETRTYYIPRKYFVEVSQADGYTTPVVFEISQTVEDELWRSMPTMPHYQPTRKDPFLPQTSDLKWEPQFNLWFDWNSTNSRDKDYYSPAGYPLLVAPFRLPVATNPSTSSFDFSYGINNPTVVFTGGLGSACWLGGNITPLNLWNMAETSATVLPSEQDTFNPDLDLVVVKTIQDPCPPGFSVPSYGAFTIFTSNGNNTGSTNPTGEWNVDNDNSSNFGYTFYTNDAHTQTMYIPATGCRYAGLLHTPTRTGSFYLTSKVSGDRYFTCFTRNRFWGNPGPVDSMSKQHCWAVWPAKEVNTNR